MFTAPGMCPWRGSHGLPKEPSYSSGRRTSSTATSSSRPDSSSSEDVYGSSPIMRATSSYSVAAGGRSAGEAAVRATRCTSSRSAPVSRATTRRVRLQRQLVAAIELRVEVGHREVLVDHATALVEAEADDRAALEGERHDHGPEPVGEVACEPRLRIAVGVEERVGDADPAAGGVVDVDRRPGAARTARPRARPRAGRRSGRGWTPATGRRARRRDARRAGRAAGRG